MNQGEISSRPSIIRWIAIAIAALLLLPFASHSASTSTELPAAADQRPAQLTYTDAVILGIVEGLTEYLPVSSTGHLILANRFLGLDSDRPIDSKSNATPRRTLREAANAYAIIIQGGAILAVLLIYRRRIFDIIAGIFGRSRTGLLLLRNLIAAFLPAAVLGLLLEDWIDRHLFGPLPVINALILGAFLMLAIEKWRRHRTSETFSEGPDLHELSISKSLVIGLLQCVAMWPGTSRSMMTIVGGYLAGLSPTRSAEFSFLLGLVTLSAASGYKTVTQGAWMFETLEFGPILVGILVATVFAALSVKWLVNYLARHGLAIFAWYRILLALAVVNLIFG
ncbi:MAG: undecaprenyl-diphosphate phosphatase [Puniceicoccales bacterium]